jgi:hypothetical protein
MIGFTLQAEHTWDKEEFNLRPKGSPGSSPGLSAILKNKLAERIITQSRIFKHIIYYSVFMGIEG